MRNGCEAEPTEETVADDVNQLVFTCPPGAETALYVVDGGGHTWPGSDFDDSIVDIVGYVTHSISANEIMWASFGLLIRGRQRRNKTPEREPL